MYGQGTPVDYDRGTVSGYCRCGNQIYCVDRGFLAAVRADFHTGHRTLHAASATWRGRPLEELEKGIKEASDFETQALRGVDRLNQAARIGAL